MMTHTAMKKRVYAMTAEEEQHNESEANAGPQLHLRDFEGPLDLLLTLIEQNEIDIMDIPIADLTQQYMAYLDDLDELDVEQASEFLLIAADLLRLKSRLLMPREDAELNDADDPRQELVFHLLTYRRTRYTALYLRTKAAVGRYMAYRVRETPARLGIRADTEAEESAADAAETFKMETFRKAANRLIQRNQLRYQDVSDKLKLLTSREKISLKERIIQTFEAIVQRGRCLFRDLFPKHESAASRVNGFLAVLELVRQRRVDARQTDPDDDIELISVSLDRLDLSDSLERDYR